jgi:hypothetical protein
MGHPQDFRPDDCRRRFWERLWGEWWFWSGRPNGGTVIFWRALQISLLVYLPALGLYSFLSAECPCGCHPSWTGFEHETAHTLPWMAAMFGAVWAGLYARFASQWGYLASAHKQLRATLVSLDDLTNLKERDIERSRQLVLWRAEFVQDALDLHLAAKSMFGPFILRTLDDPGVAHTFDTYTDAGAKQRRVRLQEELKNRFPEAARSVEAARAEAQAAENKPDDDQPDTD